MRLIWRLLWDRRVPIMLKMAIPMSLTYLIWPIDFLRDRLGIPVLGQIDDFIVLTLACIIFVRLAPPLIVREHREAIWGPAFRESDQVTEGEYRILNDEDGDHGSARNGS